MVARLEVTGRAPLSRIFPGVDEPAVYTLQQFCRAHNISNGKFYDLMRKGIGPRTMKYGTRRVISVEEAARWRERTAR
jgi:hypothetical protein